MKQMKAALVHSGVIKPFMIQKRVSYCRRLLVKFQISGDKKALADYMQVRKTLPSNLSRNV